MGPTEYYSAAQLDYVVANNAAHSSHLLYCREEEEVAYSFVDSFPSQSRMASKIIVDHSRAKTPTTSSPGWTRCGDKALTYSAQYRYTR